VPDAGCRITVQLRADDGQERIEQRRHKRRHAAARCASHQHLEQGAIHQGSAATNAATQSPAVSAVSGLGCLREPGHPTAVRAFCLRAMLLPPSRSSTLVPLQLCSVCGRAGTRLAGNMRYLSCYKQCQESKQRLVLCAGALASQPHKALPAGVWQCLLQGQQPSKAASGAGKSTGAVCRYCMRSSYRALRQNMGLHCACASLTCPSAPLLLASSPGMSHCSCTATVPCAVWCMCKMHACGACTPTQHSQRRPPPPGNLAGGVSLAGLMCAEQVTRSFVSHICRTCRAHRRRCLSPTPWHALASQHAVHRL
jgi:hypothetical protein